MQPQSTVDTDAGTPPARQSQVEGSGGQGGALDAGAASTPDAESALAQENKRITLRPYRALPARVTSDREVRPLPSLEMPMLAVISDLHFQDISRDALRGADGRTVVDVRRNVPAAALRRLVKDLVDDAHRSGETELDLVLAGDIFELNRSSMWFDSDHAGERVRPYASVNAVDKATEARLLEVLAAIRQDPDVAGGLAALQQLADGFYFTGDGDERDDVDLDAVRLHYIPGNHDRLCNAPGLRRHVRRLLGIPVSDAPFPHVLRFADGRVLVRHGHEYDRFNFARDLRGDGTLALLDDDAGYAGATLGDFVTVDIASRLPHLFRAQYGIPNIVESPIRRALYARLIEFDDVRPAAALPEFLLSTPGTTRDAVWGMLEPIARRMLDEMAESKDLARLLEPHDVPWQVDIADGVQMGLRTRRNFTSVMLREALGTLGVRATAAGEEDAAAHFVAREKELRDGPATLIISGHTHEAGARLIGERENAPLWSIDTGTWRRRLPLSLDRKTFGRIRTLTWATVYTRGGLRFETWTAHDTHGA